ncbi:MAG: hypothetical protein GY751_12620, partial [Bacteroidetes bacterium]|nr:hypothetical protein [Bacteroidota bacterium]
MVHCDICGEEFKSFRGVNTHKSRSECGEEERERAFLQLTHSRAVSSTTTQNETVEAPEECSNAQDIPAASNVTYEHPATNDGSLLRPSDNHDDTNSEVSNREDNGEQESVHHDADGYDETDDDQDVANHTLPDQGTDSSDSEWVGEDSTTCSNEESVVEFDLNLLDSRY